MVNGALDQGVAAHNSGRHEEAIPLLRQALHEAPMNPVPLALLGASLCHLGSNAEGLPLIYKAVCYDPTFVYGLTILGGCLIHQGQIGEAQGFLTRAVEISPGFNKACWNLSQCQLWAEEWQKAWDNYEYGKTVQGCRPVHFIHKPWNGENIPGKTLLLWGEQGLGDIIQFLRFLPVAQERSGANIILFVPAPLLEICTQAFPYCTVLAQNQANTVLMAWDCQASILSLPYLLGLTPSDGLEQWAAGTIKRSPVQDKWGLCWSSSASFAANAMRTIPMDAMKPLESMKTWVKVGGPTDEELPFEMQVLPHRGFYALAQEMASMEGIVTCCSAPVHLAGALGIPAKVVISKAGDWRWGRNEKGRSNPWYKSVEVYRPTVEHGFDPVIEEVVHEL